MEKLGGGTEEGESKRGIVGGRRRLERAAVRADLVSLAADFLVVAMIE